MADLVMRAREHWHSLCLHGDSRPGYEGQGALTQFMFTWRWQTWLWGPGSTDTVYVYMVIADRVMRAREHWHSLCLHGDGRLGYEGQGALTLFMFTWRWQTWLWGPGSTDTVYVYMAMADLVMRAREHWHSLCLHGDSRPGYEGQGALTQFMFTWRWQTWLWGPGSTDTVYVYMVTADLVMRAREHWHSLCLHGDSRPGYEGQGALTQFMFTWWRQTWLWGPGSTDTVYVYMVIADWVMRAREHWHSLCLHGDSRPGYEGQGALTQFMFTWWRQTGLWGPGSTDTVYVYMVIADRVMRAREHWHSLCLHGDGRLGYEGQGALTQFMFTWWWQTWL